MARKNHYFPKDDVNRSLWLNTFATNLKNHYATLGLTLADVDAAQADAKFFTYLLNAQTSTASHAQEWTIYKNALRDGEDGDYSQLPAPENLGTPPPVVPAGIIPRATALVARLKTAPGYTESIGVSLGVIGADASVGLGSVQPELTLWLDAGRVKVGWFKQGLDGLEIWVDRGSGFAYLAINTTPDYTDPTPLPSAGQSALWKYKAIYRKADKPVGKWSNIASLAVAG